MGFDAGARFERVKMIGLKPWLLQGWNELRGLGLDRA